MTPAFPHMTAEPIVRTVKTTTAALSGSVVARMASLLRDGCRAPQVRVAKACNPRYLLGEFSTPSITRNLSGAFCRLECRPEPVGVTQYSGPPRKSSTPSSELTDSQSGTFRSSSGNPHWVGDERLLERACRGDAD